MIIFFNIHSAGAAVKPNGLKKIILAEKKDMFPFPSGGRPHEFPFPRCSRWFL